MNVQWWDFIPFAGGLLNLIPAYGNIFIFRKRCIEMAEKYPSEGLYDWWLEYTVINFAALVVCWLIGTYMLLT